MSVGGNTSDLLPRSTVERLALENESRNLLSLTLTTRQMCDLEMLLNGGFSPLKGFMTKAEYFSVVESVRLPGGQVWPMPITLDVSEVFSQGVSIGEDITLQSAEFLPLAILKICDIWKPSKINEAKSVYGSPDDTSHPAIDYLFNTAGEYYIGGSLRGIQLPRHYDFKEFRLSPRELQKTFRNLGWERICGFQTRNPMHRSHFQVTLIAARQSESNILIHPVVGATKPGDVDHSTRVRCYQKMISKYPPGMAKLSLLPLAMRMAGPREALWHALIRKNYGCTHFVIGRDHAGPGKNRNGKDFYGPFAAQKFVHKFKEEIGITIVNVERVAYCPALDKYVQQSEIPEGESVLHLSGYRTQASLIQRIEDTYLVHFSGGGKRVANQVSQLETSRDS